MDFVLAINAETNGVSILIIFIGEPMNKIFMMQYSWDKCRAVMKKK